jgi:hypothetical protein
MALHLTGIKSEPADEVPLRRMIGTLIDLLTAAAWEGHDIDGGAAQETLEKLGLIEKHVATEEDAAGHDFEPGDVIFKLSALGRQCVREARQS